MTRQRDHAQWGNSHATTHFLRTCRNEVCSQSVAMLRRVSTVGLCFGLGSFASGIGAAALHGAERPLSDYTRIDVAATKTSVYLASVSMTMPTFVRREASYETTYVAKVFPYFFYNETGKLSVELPDEVLRTLERGEVIEFKGSAVNENGTQRRVEGKATPADASSGKLKVRVFYSKRIELIFNTTYRFPDAKGSSANPPTS